MEKFPKLTWFYQETKKHNKWRWCFYSFEKDQIKLINILAIRVNGKLKKENNILLAQVKFPINFQEPIIAYKKLKKNRWLFVKQKKCDSLVLLEKENKELNLNIMKSRIADLNPKIQNLIKNINLLKMSKPIFYGNNGYTYIKCDIKKAKLSKVDYKKLKTEAMNKYFLIYSEKLLKRLYNESNIIQIEKIKWQDLKKSY